MNGSIFVDTNILLYALDRTAGEKNCRAREAVEHLWTSGNGVLSTQVLQELCFNLGRTMGGTFSSEDRERVIINYSRWRVVVNSAESILSALDLEKRYRISFWDALIIHAAQEASASVLYSEDLNPGQRYGSVQVINPLTDSFVMPS